jgi:DNA polymerase-3 subunit epsilon
MREIVLDTETTGLDPAQGHRIVEIGAVELANHIPTGRTFHHYIDPLRDMPEEAFAIHGISAEMLRGKPVFSDLADEFLSFIGDAQLVIHNAAFDMRFLNHELTAAGRPNISWGRAIDTLEIARGRFPGSPNSLDALCRRFGVDNSGRTKHGALLDSELLAEVYLELIGGRQPDFGLSVADRPGAVEAAAPDWVAPPRPAPLPPLLTEAEAETHAAMVKGLGPSSLWAALTSGNG